MSIESSRIGTAGAVGSEALTPPPEKVSASAEEVIVVIVIIRFIVKVIRDVASSAERLTVTQFLQTVQTAGDH